jgi:hypothetical protein
LEGEENMLEKALEAHPLEKALEGEKNTLEVELESVF